MWYPSSALHFSGKRVLNLLVRYASLASNVMLLLNDVLSVWTCLWPDLVGRCNISGTRRQFRAQDCQHDVDQRMQPGGRCRPLLHEPLWNACTITDRRFEPISRYVLERRCQCLNRLRVTFVRFVVRLLKYYPRVVQGKPLAVVQLCVLGVFSYNAPRDRNM